MARPRCNPDNATSGLAMHERIHFEGLKILNSINTPALALMALSCR